MIGIVLTGGGNIRSLSNALEFLDLKYDVLSDGQSLERYNAIIIPGVGHFRTAMKTLQKSNYHEEIKQFHLSGKKIIGICLGFQLLFEASDEAPGCPGLSLLPGCSTTFNLTDDYANMHIGWRKIFSDGPKKHLELYHNKKFYFMHCYRVARQKVDVDVAWSEYGGDQFISAIWHENVRAFQFHPERSGITGLKLLGEALLN